MPGGNSETVKFKTMTTSDKLADKIVQPIIRGEIDLSKINSIEKKVGVKLNLSDDQLAWSALVYANRQEFMNK